MVRRALRAALFAATLVAFWTLGRPAFASPAPLCDDRGASAIAPPPAFEAPDEAIRQARSSTACERDRLPLDATIGAAQHGVAPPIAGTEPALPVRGVKILLCRRGWRRRMRLGARPSWGVRIGAGRPPRG